MLRLHGSFQMHLFSTVFARLLIAVFSVALATTAVAAETLKARYSVSLVGLHIGEIGFETRLEQANYKVDLNAHLTGVASWIAHVKMALASSGQIPRRHSSAVRLCDHLGQFRDGADAAHVAQCGHGAGRRYLAAFRRFRRPRAGHGGQ